MRHKGQTVNTSQLVTYVFLSILAWHGNDHRHDYRQDSTWHLVHTCQVCHIAYRNNLNAHWTKHLSV